MEARERQPGAPRPGWASRLVEVLQPVSVRADRLGSMDVFSTLRRADLELAAGILRETLTRRGRRMTAQGQTNARLWLVLEGEALVSTDARPIRVVGIGEFIGLAGMLNDIASPETTIALSSIRAFEADRPGLERLMTNAAIRKRLIAAEALLSDWSRRHMPARLRS